MQLIAEGVGFSYPKSDHQILTDLDLDVASGSSTAILGPSGSGKTTLLSILGGLLKPQQGQVHCIDSVGRTRVPREMATWILQTVSLLPERTVVDNVALGAYLDGATYAEAHDRARRALAEVGLSGREQNPARVLSGGEGQRVAVARAMASRRPLTFADEPTGQLDSATSDRVLDAFFALAPRTIVLITHDTRAAARCDHVLELTAGKLVSGSLDSGHRR